MTAAKSGKSAPIAQIDKFKEAAREIETDDDDKRFDERLKEVARQNRPAKEEGR